MKTKLKGNETFTQVENDGNVSELLKMIRVVTREMNTNESVYNAIDKSKRKYYTYIQAPEDDDEIHSRTFK